MTPVSVRWMYVTRSNTSRAGELRQTLCAKGDTGMIGLVLVAPMIVIRRTHWTYDASPEVRDNDDVHRVYPVRPVPIAQALSLADYLAHDGISGAGARLLRWFKDRGYERELLHVDDYVSEEPQAVTS
jgi:hypothetical protein